MAKKITIQHLYSTGTTKPDVTKLELGEIAICANAGNERIFTKNSEGKLATFPTYEQVESLIDDATSGVVTDASFGELQSGLSKHITHDLADEVGTASGITGHVLLYNGDLKNGEHAKGTAAGLGHTHSQYLTAETYKGTITGITAGSGLTGGGTKTDGATGLTLNVGAGTGIAVTDDAVSINETYQNKITSGVTALEGLNTHANNKVLHLDTGEREKWNEAYGWGNHASAGYAPNSGLVSHTSNTTMHITGEERANWNKAKNDIDAFLFATESATTAIDTLKELQDYIETHGTEASEMTSAINQNTADINNINSTIGSGFDSGNTISTNINALKQSMVVSGQGGSNISVVVSTVNDGGKKITIAHTGTTAEVDYKVLTGTTTTALTWGGTFIVPTKISHDANGHYVSGTTSTFTMPSLPIASTQTPGIVQLQGGDLKEETSTSRAAAANHKHSQYVSFADLSDNTKDDVIVISCGTY